MQLNPCKWDSISPCKECKKDICSSCHNQEFCDSCIMESEETCFAFCDVTKEPILSTIDINFPEQYAVIRCRRERKKNFDSKYYSGFCKEHCETSENIQDLYSGLPEYRKKAIHYMISSNTCDFLNAIPPRPARAHGCASAGPAPLPRSARSGTRTRAGGAPHRYWRLLRPRWR